MCFRPSVLVLREGKVADTDSTVLVILYKWQETSKEKRQSIIILRNVLCHSVKFLIASVDHEETGSHEDSLRLELT